MHINQSAALLSRAKCDGSIHTLNGRFSSGTQIFAAGNRVLLETALSATILLRRGNEQGHLPLFK
jgi:hypothetical protein